MKKYLIIFVLIVALSAGLAAVYGFNISASGEKVSYRENVYYGDKSAAEGLNIELNTQLEYELLWNTKLRIASENDEVVEADTVLSKYKDSVKYRTIVSDPSIYITTLQSYALFSEYEAPYRLEYFYPEYSKLLDSIVEEANKKGSCEKTVKFADYFDNYPIDISFDSAFLYYKGKEINSNLELYDELSDSAEETIEAYKYFMDFFKIPVPSWAETGILANNTGGGLDLYYNDPKSYYFDTRQIFDGNNIFFTLKGEYYDENGVLYEPDYSQIKGGYGIFRLPVKKFKLDGDKDLSALEIHPENLETVYALPEGASIADFTSNKDGSAFFLVYTLGNESRLDVIDAESLKLKQSLTLEDREDFTIENVFNEKEDYLITILRNSDYQNFLILSAKGEDGIYKNVIGENLDVKFPESYTVYYGEAGIKNSDWDGKRLALASVLRGDDAGTVSVYVYDKSGLTYAADYVSSLNPCSNENNIYTYIYADDYRPLYINWD